MDRTQAFLILCTVLAAGISAEPARATIIGGVDFPLGAISLADAVTDYSPVIKSGQPTAPNRNSANSVGVPDSSSVSLGDGGFLTLRFTNNFLTGSGSSALDLWIFEIGPDVEDTFVEISKDNIAYFSVGKVFGSTSGIDIDAFGFGTADFFSYIRLQDDPDEGDQTGGSVGADIDAVGAISTVVSPVPEPSTYALCVTALAGILLATRFVRGTSAEMTPMSSTSNRARSHND